MYLHQQVAIAWACALPVTTLAMPLNISNDNKYAFYSAVKSNSANNIGKIGPI